MRRGRSSTRGDVGAKLASLEPQATGGMRMGADISKHARRLAGRCSWHPPSTARVAARQDNEVGTLGSANVLPANAQLGDGDRERNAQTSPADDPSKAVCDSDTHVVAQENGPQAHGEMANDEQRGEGIM